jgi:trimeric autotransporter adhesin
MKNKTTLVAALAALIFVAGCAGNSRFTQSTSQVACSVSGSAASIATTAQITVTCSGGTGPYSISSVLIGGRTPDSLTGSNSSFSFSTTLSASLLSMATLQGVSGSLTVRDASGTSSSYSFNILASGTTGTTAGCTLTPSTTAANTGATVTYTAAVASGWGTAPYTFSGFSPGVNGTVSSNLASASSTTASAAATYSLAGSPQASVSISDSSGRTSTCTTSVTVSGSPVSGLSCWLNQSINAAGNAVIQAQSSTGEALAFSSVTPVGDGTVVSLSNPAQISYSTPGVKTVNARAYSVSNASAVCNTGSALTITFNVAAASGSLTCSLGSTQDAATGNTILTVSNTSGRTLAFANLVAGADGTVVGFGNPTTIRYTSSGLKSVTTQAYDIATGMFCNAGQSMTLSFFSNGSAGSALSCALSQGVDSQGRVLITANASNGAALQMVDFTAGQDGSVVNSGNPTAVSYAYAGQKTVSAKAYAPSSGLWCNGGSTLSLSFYAAASNGGSGGPLACTAALSLNPVARGVVSRASFMSTGGTGAVSLLNIVFPSNAGVGVQFISATQANVTFSLSGVIPLTYVIRDSIGNQTSCVVNAQVF